MNEKLIQVDGKVYKECSVIMLPTEKESNILKCIKEFCFHKGTAVEDAAKVGDIELGVGKYANLEYFQYLHLYILSNDEIQEGDWCLNTYGTNNSIFKITKVMTDGYEGQKLGGDDHCFYGLSKTLLKIIATTDESIIVHIPMGADYESNTNLPRPSNDFVLKYVALEGNIDEILVEVNGHMDYIGKDTPEDIYFGSLKIAKDNTITIKRIQVQLPKTKEQLFDAMQYYYEYIHLNGYVTPEVWYTQHKHF